MEAGPQAELGTLLPVWSALPFAGMLLSIALFPLLAVGFWHRHYAKVAAAWAVVVIVPFVLAYGGAAVHELEHTVIVDYDPFFLLLWALFKVACRVSVRRTLRT